MLYWRKNVLVWPAYIDNVIDLLMLLAEHPAADGEGFLVHDGESDTLQNFCLKIAETIGEKPPSFRIPYWTAYSAASVMEFMWKTMHRTSRPLLTKYTVKNLGSRLQWSIEKAKNKLGWQPRISYQEGFARTMTWLKNTNPETWKQK
jgi:nucleoside-diphosphate-sugar epimerase